LLKFIREADSYKAKMAMAAAPRSIGAAVWMAAPLPEEAAEPA